MSIPAQIAARGVNTSPTEGQKRAGNYRKAHVLVHGLPISIENPRGSHRVGMNPDGSAWRCKTPAHYGYIKGTEGADQDHIDVFLGPHPKSPRVYVIDQKDAETGDFDEHKAMLGFASNKHARNVYLSAFSDGKGKKRLGAMTEMTVAQFKNWLATGNTKAPLHRAAGGGVSVTPTDEWLRQRGAPESNQTMWSDEDEARRQLDDQAKAAAEKPWYERAYEGTVDAAKRFADYDRQFTEDVGSLFTNLTPASKVIRKATGTVGDTAGAGPREQLWPEKMLRSGASLPGDVASGAEPMWQIGPDGQVHTADKAIERAQDTAGMAGGASAGSSMERAAAGSGRDLRVLGQQVLASDTAQGAPVAAVAKQRQFNRPPQGETLSRFGEQDARLPPEAARAVDDWVGGTHDALTNGTTGGIMNSDLLEKAYGGKGGFLTSSVDPAIVREQIEAAAAPMRQALKEQHGDTLRLYRVQEPVAPGSEPRALLSMTSDPKFAQSYAGARDVPAPYSEAQIRAAEKKLAESGEVQIDRHTLRPNPENPKYLDIYDRNGEYVTDTDSVRAFIDDENGWRAADERARDKKSSRILEYDVPVDEVVWFTNRFGQNEFIVKNPKAFGEFYSDSGKGGAPVAALAEQARPALEKTSPVNYKATAKDAGNGSEAGRAAETATPGGPGVGGGSRSVAEAEAAAARWAGAAKPIEGLPQKPIKIGDDYYVPGPVARARDVADTYMQSSGMPYKPPTKYHPVEPARARAIGRAFEKMEHNPDDPKVQRSYDALINETIDQYKAIKDSGLQIEFIKPDQPDPYFTSPRLAIQDVAQNNHLWVYPTETGFGKAGAAAVDQRNPMLRKTGEKIGDHELLANDMFRIVHDYFGHIKEGNGFRASGEDNAWRSHFAMYSPEARPAMTTETRGQNSVLNFGAKPLYKVLGEKKARELYGDEGRGAKAQSGSVERGGVSNSKVVSDLQSLARDDGSLLQPEVTKLGELRREGHNGASSDAVASGVSGRDGVATNSGTSKQRRELRAEQRPVGDVASKPSKSTAQRSADSRFENHGDVGVGGGHGSVGSGDLDAAKQVRLERGKNTDHTEGKPRWKTITVGEHNRTAKSADTVFADQKVGLLPNWVMKDALLSDSGFAGSGIGGMRWNPLTDKNYKIEAMRKRGEGIPVGKRAKGHEFKRPDPAKGSFERHAAEARAGFKNDAANAREDFSRATNSFMKPEDWEFMESGKFRAAGGAVMSDAEFEAAGAPVMTDAEFEKAAPAKSSTTGAMGRGAWQGLTMGFGDEIRGIGEAGGVKENEWNDPVSVAKGAYKYWSGDKEAEAAYDKGVKRERAADTSAKEEHPWAFLGGEFAGAIPTMIAIPGGTVARGAALSTRAMQGARTGGIYGGISGAGDGTDAESRVAGAGAGTVGGIVGGAAAAPAGDLIGALYSRYGAPVVSAVRGMVNPEGEAARRVFKALEADAVDIAAGKAKGMTGPEWSAAKAAGEPVTLADLGSARTQSILRSSANTSPEGRGLLEKTFNDRFEGQSERVAADVRNLVSGGANAGKTADQLVAEYDIARIPAYKHAFTRPSAQSMWDEDLQQMAQAPAVQEAIRMATVTAKNEAAKFGMPPPKIPFVFQKDGRMTLGTPQAQGPTGATAPANVRAIPNLQFWDAVKKNLDAGDRTSQAWGKTLRNHLDSIVPEYGDARGVASKFFGERDALEAGRALAGKRMDPEQVAKAMRGMGPEEKELFREGHASDWAGRVIGRIGDTRDITKAMFNSPNERKMAEVIYGPTGMAKIQTRMAVETIMNGARNALGNSTTARQLIEAGLAGGAIGGYLDGDWKGALAGAGAGLGARKYLATEMASGARKLIGKVDAKTAARVAELLTSDDPRLLAQGVKIATSHKNVRDGLARIANQLALSGNTQGATRITVPVGQKLGAVPSHAEENQPQ